MGVTRNYLGRVTDIKVGDVVQVITYYKEKHPNIHHRRTGIVLEMNSTSSQIYVELTHEPAGLPISVNRKPSSVKVWFDYKSLVKL